MTKFFATELGPWHRDFRVGVKKQLTARVVVDLRRDFGYEVAIEKMARATPLLAIRYLIILVVFDELCGAALRRRKYIDSFKVL